MLAACGDGERPPTTQTPVRPSRPALRLVAITDLNGYLEPCGCQSRPLGGIDKAAAKLRELRADGTPTLFVAAGNLFFAGSSHHEPALDGAAADAAQQARWQAETLARALQQLALEVAVPGPADLAQGPQVVADLARAGGVRLLDTGESNAAAPAAAVAKGRADPAAGAGDSVLIHKAGLAIGVWGLRDPAVAAPGSPPTDLVARSQQLTRDLRARGAQLVIGLLHADARAARRVAGASPELDLLVHAGMESAASPPPERIGSATLVRAAHDGHGLLVVDLVRSSDGPFTDVSVWSRKAQKETLARTAEDLAARIATWKRDPAVERALVAEQEARLSRLRSEIAALEEPVRTMGNTLSARFIELDPDVPSDPAMRALLDAHDKRVNEHNRVALADVRPKPVPPGTPGYVGSQRCGQCHAPALAWWKGHAHGRAYATLEQRNKQFNLSCVGCHVTGYNQPGGATVVHNEGLTDVGCESCHGPGSLHAEDADVDAKKNVTLQVAEAVCTQCHNPEHSDRFAYDAYRAMLIAPGHGRPTEAAQ